MSWESQAGSGVVAAAMSGGVDSAVVAALLVDRGINVFGITARMTREYSQCCAADDVVRAADMCRQLGIEHHVVDVCAEFDAGVIEPFVDSYIGGETPSPCVRCNQFIKFGVLLERARELGAESIATGHYVRCQEYNGQPALLRGVDPVKDQSYFLARLSKGQLQSAVFPLGELRKSEVVQLAEKFGLKVARGSRESQDLCFVIDSTHGEWIDLRSFAARGAGDIVDCGGNVVGRHRGIHHYTVGQRKGLGVALGYPVYVVELDVGANRVVVGPREHVMSRQFVVRDMRWDVAAPQNHELTCRVRYNHREALCSVCALDGGLWQVKFDEEQFAITPGQLAVFYAGERLAGSGWILKCESN